MIYSPVVGRAAAHSSGGRSFARARRAIGTWLARDRHHLAALARDLAELHRTAVSFFVHTLFSLIRGTLRWASVCFSPVGAEITRMDTFPLPELSGDFLFFFSGILVD